MEPKVFADYLTPEARAEYDRANRVLTHFANLLKTEVGGTNLELAYMRQAQEVFLSGGDFKGAVTLVTIPHKNTSLILHSSAEL